MKKRKKLLIPLLAAAVAVTGIPAAYAAEEDTGYADVSAGAWYADAVEYVSENGLMSGTGTGTFSPEAGTSRAMLVTTLYRAAGSPDVSGSADFSDVPEGAWYADAVSWATGSGIVSGYGDGRFGSDDPVSREQIAVILWRYAGSPQAEPGTDFADESDISSYASGAVDWVRADGIMSGMEGNRFDPRGTATRAQIAAVLRNYLTSRESGEDNPGEIPGSDIEIGSGPLSIADQGIFSAGGITLTSDGTFDPENQWEETGAGQTSHVDHANVLYQIPEEETGLPMVFLHGYGQSRMGWMTTPDGREGWSDMFLRMGHSVFLIDQPRRGEAGATSVSGDISTKTLDQRWYTQFRIGRWENGQSVVNEGSQFPNDPESLDQFFRQMTPDTGMTSDMGADFDNETVARAVAATIDEVYERTGKDSILVTHSQGGGPGWTAAQYTDHIAAIVAIEPGGAPAADSADFRAVADQHIPVTMYFGDYIDNGDPAIQATGMWQAMRQTCYDFEEAYNAQGGNCTVIDLPEEGITGNDHFMFQDLNNDVIAKHIENWIRENAAA